MDRPDSAMKEQRFSESLTNAIKGVGHTWRTERNFRIHSAAVVLVLIIAGTAKLQPLEWAMLFLAITLVLVCELVNTAIENAVDLFMQDFHPLAQVAKDVAAGAVLVASVNAVIVGLFIFRRFIWQVLTKLM